MTIQEDKKNIIEQLHERQFKANKKDSKFIIFNIEFGGFGAMMARRKLGLQFGHYFNRTVIFNFTNYVYDDPFQSTSNLTIENLKDLKVGKFNYLIDQEDQVVFFDFDDYWNNVPVRKEYHEKTVGNLSFAEFSGVLLNFLNLKYHYSQLLNNSTVQIYEMEPMIGIHIRRGDKEVESPHIPVNRYLSELYKVRSKTGINKVFVCSDSDLAIRELIDSDSDFQFFFDEDELRHNDKVNNIVHARSDEKSKIRETEVCIKNIYQLSKCSYIIGQSNVQFAKLAVCKAAERIGNSEFYSLIDPFNLKNIQI